MRINKLSTAGVSAATKKIGKHGDGGGLWLKVRRPGDASWVFAYMIAGRARELGLGPLHSVSLAEARNRAREARQLILDGKDPIEVKHAAANAAKVERLKTVTFREAARDFLRSSKVQGFKNDKHRKQWGSTLERHVFPVFGDLPLQAIDTAIVLKALAPVWERTPETGSRLRARIERVFDWAKPLGLFVGDNPAALERLKDHLPAKRKAEHHAAMPWAEVPAYMATLRSRDSVSAKALEFTILTATRTSETLGAQWSEIDLDAALWIIPAERMKASRPHRVPLCPRAIELLRALPRSGALVFPAKSGRALSNMAMLQLLRGTAGNGYTVHGFRSTFSDWARDRTAYARDVVEMALAHTIKDKTEAAYRRGDAIEKRARLMTEWCRFCSTSGNVGATVTAIRDAI